MGKVEELLRDQGKTIRASASRGASGGAGWGNGIVARREPQAREKGVSRSAEAFVIELARIAPDPDQPRKEFDDASIERMADSLRKRGQLMPIQVRWSPSLGKWLIVAGERRVRGANRAGLATLLCVERKGSMDGSDLLADQLTENLQREDLSRHDQGRAFRQLMEMNGWTAGQLAGQLSIPASTIAECLSLLELPEDVRERVDLAELSESAAVEIAKIEDPALQSEVAAKVVDQGLNRAETREEVRKVRAAAPKAPNPRTLRRKAASPPRLDKTWKHKSKETGFTLVAERKKGIRQEELIEFLKGAVAAAEGQLQKTG